MSRTSFTDEDRRWVALRLTVPASDADEIAGGFGSRALGIESSDAEGPGDEVRLTAYFPDRASAAPDFERLRAGAFAVEVVEVADGRWVERYHAGLRPRPLGDRFLVVPGESVPVTADRTAIRLVPGQAFGTGEHPTTRMCAAGLEATVRPGQRWLDLGTGSGVLAVVAAHLGARVVAVDVDPDAVAVATEVVRGNRVDGTVEIRTGSADAWDGPPPDGVVANISERYFLANAATIAGLLPGGGMLVASGFLAEDAGDVESALCAHGFDIVTRVAEDPWRGVVAVRR